MYYRLDPTLEHAPSVFLQRYVGIAGLWAPLPYFPSVRLSSIFVLLQHATEIAGPPAQRAHNLRSLSRVEVVQVSSSLQRSCTVCGKALVSGRVHLLQCSRKICKVYSQNNSTRIGLGTCLVGRSSQSLTFSGLSIVRSDRTSFRSWNARTGRSRRAVNESVY